MFGTSLICKDWYPDTERAKNIYAETLDNVASAAKWAMRSIDKFYTAVQNDLISASVSDNDTLDSSATVNTRRSFQYKLYKDLERFKDEYAKSCIIRDWLNHTFERNALLAKISELQDKLFAKQYDMAATLVDKDIVNIDTVFNKMCEEANK